MNGTKQKSVQAGETSNKVTGIRHMIAATILVVEIRAMEKVKHTMVVESVVKKIRSMLKLLKSIINKRIA